MGIDDGDDPAPAERFCAGVVADLVAHAALASGVTHGEAFKAITGV